MRCARLAKGREELYTNGAVGSATGDGKVCMGEDPSDAGSRGSL